MIKVSVIIPVYNTESYLKDCLDSAINQTLRDIEIICINDGSTDHSLDILKEYESKDCRIKVHLQENKGLAATRNVGIRLSRGEYIYFFDSDDLIELDALEVLYNKAHDNNLDVIYFNAKPLYDSDALAKKHSNYTNYYLREKEYSEIRIGSEMFATLLRDKTYLSSACLQFFNSQYLKSIELFFYEGIYHEDEFFTLACMLRARRVCHIKRQFFIRRIREGSIMTEEKGYKHYYGYLTNYIQTLFFLSSTAYPKNITQYIILRMEGYLSNATKIYRIHNGAEQGWLDKLSEFERYIFEKMTPMPLSKPLTTKTISTTTEQGNLQEIDSKSNTASNAGLLHKIRSGFRLIKQYGLVYTVRYTLKKIFG